MRENRHNFDLENASELLIRLVDWPDAVQTEADEEEDKEVVCEPEDLEVGAADHRGGWWVDEDEGHRDHHACNARPRLEDLHDRVLSKTICMYTITNLIITFHCLYHNMSNIH